MTPRPRPGSPLLACVLVLALAGCGGNENTLAPHSHAESSITTLFWVVFGFCCFGFGVICVLLFLGWWRRNKPTLPGGGGERAATTIVIGAGVALPIVLLCALFVYGDLVVTKATGAPSTTHTQMTIDVTGHQFWWEIRYPGTPVVTANEIHIPVQTRVKVVTSTADVIHSLWVPRLNRKIDVIPGQTNAVVFDARKPGIFRGQCAEFCGVEHGLMALLVVAQPPTQFDRWLASQAKPAPGSSGMNAFVGSGCSGCHEISGAPQKSRYGPDLSHFGSRRTIGAGTLTNTPEHLADWIRNPQSLKPGNKMPDLGLPEAEIQVLVRYLESLK